MAPSPKKATATCRVPRVFADSAAPSASGVPAPTTPVAPSMPTVVSAMCIEPPVPRLVPVALPYSSAIIRATSTPLAIAWPWPRCVLAT
ncbi:MAG TPA: hypothetical protein VGO86_10705 [Candidatus Dormibacteraeota bacterium]